MSNKKLFGVVFFLLSCCEFAQVAYSKHIFQSTVTTNFSPTGLYCKSGNALGAQHVFNGNSSSYFLPK